MSGKATQKKSANFVAMVASQQLWSFISSFSFFFELTPEPQSVQLQLKTKRAAQSKEKKRAEKQNAKIAH